MEDRDLARRRSRDAEMDAYCARLGDAELARLLSLIVLPVVEQAGAARALVQSAIARLVRADGDAVPPPTSDALLAAIKAVCARGGAVPLPLFEPGVVRFGRPDAW